MLVKKLTIGLVSLGVILSVVAIGTYSRVGALTDTVTLRPNADSYSSGTNWSGVGGSGCSNLFCRVNEISPSTAEYMNHATGTISTFYLDLTDPPYIGQGVTEFRMRSYTGSANAGFLDSLDTFGMRAQYGMTAVDNGTDILLPSGSWRSNSFATGNYTYQWFEQAQAGSWTIAQLSDAAIGFTRVQAGLAAQIQRVATAEVVVTYTSPPDWNQSNYRVYQANSSTTPGAPLAAQNTAATLQNQGDAFRIRMGLVAAGTAWNASFGSYILQYGVKSGSCSASSYSDVQSGSGAIRWYNDSPVDGSAISSYAQDPTGTKTYQTYRESNPFTNDNAVPLNNYSLWDFSLQDASGSPGTVYCFRIVKADAVGSFEPITYGQYAEVQVVGTLDIWFVNTAQTTLPNPSIPFASRYILSTQCQTSTSQTPAGGLYIRINNDLVTNGWTATIAPTLGSSAYWRDVPDVNRYDFNDPAGSPAGCFNGSDGDLFAGQMTVNASTASAMRQKAGCTSTGLSAGSNASFNEGVVDNITLFTASSSSQRFCWWDIGGYGITQTIPPATPDGTYSLDMTITVTAS